MAHPRHYHHRSCMLWLLLALIPTFISLMPAVQAASPAALTGCTELLVNGDFETPGGWLLGLSPIPPEYVSSPVHGGSRSMRLGNVGLSNQLSYSSIRQTVTIPTSATSAEISFWVWTESEPNAGNDRQELLLLVTGSPPQSAPLDILWRVLVHGPSWTRISFALSHRIGQTFDIYFNVYNDGQGGRTAMYVDDVTLTVCYGPTASSTVTSTPTPTATPSPSPTMTEASPTSTPTATTSPTPTETATPLTATPTSTPTFVPTPTTATPPLSTCSDLIANGGFEYDGAWILGRTLRMPAYAGPPSPIHTGNRSMRLGTESATIPDVVSYSSIRQQVTIPTGVQTARISFWYYPISEDSPGGLDRQELILLNPWSGTTERILWRVTENDRIWKHLEFDLTPYRGRTLIIYFNARNDGDGLRTAMYLDDVNLLICYPSPTPLPTSAAVTPVLATATPMMPAPTPLPLITPPLSPTPTFVTPTPLPLATFSPPVPTTPTTFPTVTPTLVTLAVEPLTPSPTPTAKTATRTPTAVGAAAAGHERTTRAVMNQLGPWAILILVMVIVIMIVMMVYRVFGHDQGS